VVRLRSGTSRKSKIRCVAMTSEPSGPIIPRMRSSGSTDLPVQLARRAHVPAFPGRTLAPAFAPAGRGAERAKPSRFPRLLRGFRATSCRMACRLTPSRSQRSSRRSSRFCAPYRRRMSGSSRRFVSGYMARIQRAAASVASGSSRSAGRFRSGHHMPPTSPATFFAPLLGSRSHEENSVHQSQHRIRGARHGGRPC
jgi:hypothetical protein